MKLSIIALIMLFAVASFGQNASTVQSTLDQIINHVEHSSLYRNTVKWDTLKATVRELAKGSTSVDDLKPSLNYLLGSIGDEHGRIFHNQQILASYYNGPKEHHKSMTGDIYNAIQMGQEYSFHAEMVEQNIGYVRIVGMPMGDNEKMAAKIQDEVCRLANAGAEDWIIDLRYNGGGNMHPMAEGLALIIGDGYVGGSKGITENENSIWQIENGDFYYDDYSIELKDNCRLNDVKKVAVLTSSYTASSGEAISVILKGRENTKFFGQKTYGMITVTDWEVISDSTAMAISVSYYQDRNGKVYEKFVDVDEETPFEIEPLSATDQCLKKAKTWIAE